MSERESYTHPDACFSIKGETRAWEPPVAMAALKSVTCGHSLDPPGDAERAAVEA